MKYHFKQKLAENERVTITLLAVEIGVTQGTLSNYLSGTGKRRIPFNLAFGLETITGIEKDLWLDVSNGKEDPFELKKRLGLFGRMSETKKADDTLRENFNRYIDKQNVLQGVRADWREIG